MTEHERDDRDLFCELVKNNLFCKALGLTWRESVARGESKQRLNNKIVVTILKGAEVMFLGSFKEACKFRERVTNCSEEMQLARLNGFQ